MSAEIAERQLPEQRNGGMLEGLSEANDALVMAASIEDVKKIHDFAGAAQAYARARGLRDDALEAGALRIRAERAAGAIRASLPRLAAGNKPRSFDYEAARRLRESGLTMSQVAKELGVPLTGVRGAARRGFKPPPPPPPYGRRLFDEDFNISERKGASWEQLALISQDVFESTLSMIREADSKMSADALLGRLNRSAIRVESCIYRCPDGRLRLIWKQYGRQHTLTLRTKDLAEARRRLALAKGMIKHPPMAKYNPGGNAARELSNAHEYAMKGSVSVAKVLTKEMYPDTRKAVNDAVYALHQAEDALVRALNLL